MYRALFTIFQRGHVKDLSNNSNKKSFVSLIENHKNLLKKSETIFFVYVEELAHIDRNEDAKKYLLEYRDVYGKYFEFWNVYLNIDDSIKEEFIGLCKENKIVYMTGHAISW